MIDAGWFTLLWFIGCLYMFLSGPWQEFGNKNPALAFFITVFGGAIFVYLVG
tara:strand:- start:219 stop:374 length:156 start_codon:yes stop_codon:yes gene_type:complete